jgi:phosphopantetheinyl transferase
MPQHVLPFQPQGVEIVLWRLTESPVEGHELQSHFPWRQIDALPTARQQEHHAVTLALNTMLGHADWRLEHDEHGKPWLLEGEANGRQALSVSHCIVGDTVWAAVARWADGRTTGGIDLVQTRDARLQRIAGRVMSSTEQSQWRGREAWAWATKEAMFKGHGPALDFQTEAILHDLTEAQGDRPGLLRGEVRGTPWHGAWTLVDGELLLVWTA